MLRLLTTTKRPDTAAVLLTSKNPGALSKPSQIFIPFLRFSGMKIVLCVFQASDKILGNSHANRTAPVLKHIPGLISQTTICLAR